MARQLLIATLIAAFLMAACGGAAPAVPTPPPPTLVQPVICAGLPPPVYPGQAGKVSVSPRQTSQAPQLALE